MKVIPIFYAVMSNKSTSAYEAIFNYIEIEVFEMKPMAFMTDFEAGMRKAIKKCYPDAKLYGCWYHFCAAVRRKMTSNRLRKLIDGNRVAMGIYCKLLRLPLLPPDHIEEGYKLIVKEARAKRLCSDFSKLFTYFENYWLAMVRKWK